MTCEYNWVSGCCINDSDCPPGAPCTMPLCFDSTCTYPNTPSCIVCLADSDCPDKSGYTATCTNYECSYTPTGGCTTASDCPTPANCLTATCVNSVCGTTTKICTNSCPRCFRARCNLTNGNCDCARIPGCNP